MKTILVAIIIIITFAFVTKPSDQSCVDKVKDTVSSTTTSYQKGFLSMTDEDLAAQYGLRIEDNFLFKSIYRKGSNETIAIGFFGVVIGVN
jgi:hypothetical protein